MIYVFCILLGVFVASIVWFLVLGLAVSAKERDEREARTYSNLYPPDVPSWVNGPKDAA